MNYSYTIFKNDSAVQELFYDTCNTFSIFNLVDPLYEDMINRNSDIRKVQSYRRTKKWLIENHPEFLI